MRIVCPSCAGAYEVPDSRLAPGRAVLCARCGMNWMPIAAPEPELEPLPGPVSEPEPDGPPPDVPDLLPTASSLVAAPPDRPGHSKTRRDRAATVGWAVSLAVLLTLTWAAYAWRTNIMQAWPPSERFYAVLGFAPR